MDKLRKGPFIYKKLYKGKKKPSQTIGEYSRGVGIKELF